MEFMPDDSMALEKLFRDILDQYDKDDIIDMLTQNMLEDEMLVQGRVMIDVPDEMSDEEFMERVHDGTALDM